MRSRAAIQMVQPVMQRVIPCVLGHVATVGVMHPLALVFVFCPRKPFEPFALSIQKLSDIEPLINLAGAAFGITAEIMGNRWSLAAVFAHIFEAFLCPSIGFA